MTIEKLNDHLWVTSNIYFDENSFCIRPYISLVAYKDKTNYGWDANTIGIAIHDYDDFDVGFIYKTETDNFISTLHELINWMRDHEQGISSYEKLWEPYSFFPDCGCERTIW